MTDTLQASYDELPYTAGPRHATHPDRAATLATLLGMKPAPVDRCRVLELGCGIGGNLIPLAVALPGSQFVGIDLSPRQIAGGQAVVDALGLTNIELRALSILDVDESLGSFDYLICHGVYSWVPAAVQDKILTVCKRHLAAQGVAYISYNTYPGWHLRAIARELMGYHVRQFADAHIRAQQARAFLGFVAGAVPDPEGTYGRVLRDEVELLRPNADWYIAHEHLEEVNQPVYFHQFAERAAARGLQYLGEAGQHTHLGGLRPEVQQTLRQLADDLIQLEQYLDFLRGRSFRRTLLCHAEVALNRAPPPGVVTGLYALAQALPVARHPDICSTASEEFRSEAGATVSTNLPLVKAALVVLAEALPRSLPFESLWAKVTARLGAELDAASRERGRRALTEVLLHFYLSNVVVLQTHAPAFVLELGERPVASPLARLQAATAGPIACLRHCEVDVTDLDRVVLRHLDGNHDRASLVEALVTAAQDGSLAVRRDGEVPGDPASLRAALGEELESSLRRLANRCLLVA